MEIIQNKKPEKIFLIKKIKNQKKWNKIEDKKLIELAKEYNEKKWKEISLNFINKSPLQCFSRFKRIKPGMNKGTWTKEEDEILLKLINKYGKNWSKISKEFLKRNGKQIRDRYINVLSPNINRNKFNYEEDMQIIKLYNQFGPKWSKIKNYFNNRTTDMIKNRFYSCIKKKYHLLLIENIKDNNSNLNEKNDGSGVISDYSTVNKNSSTISKLSYQSLSDCIDKDFEKISNNNINNINLNNCESLDYSFEDLYFSSKLLLQN